MAVILGALLAWLAITSCVESKRFNAQAALQAKSNVEHKDDSEGEVSRGEIRLMSAFAGPEHMQLGDAAWQHFRNNIRIILPKQNELMMKLVEDWLSSYMQKLSFGSLVSLSGDFYASGIRNYPDDDPERLFKNLMAPSLVVGNGAFTQYAPLDVIWEIEERLKGGYLDNLLQYLKQQGELGATTHVIDSSITRNLKQYWLDWNNYKSLAEVNFNHFGKNSQVEYLQVHEEALKMARVAGKMIALSNDEGKRELAREKLHLAFQLEAIAAHYLTDGFAAGHIRVPRTQLQAVCNMGVREVGGLTGWAGGDTPLGGLMTKLMHDQDGDRGLLVTNRVREPWKAFGDGKYFDEENEQNRFEAQEAVEAGLMQILIEFVNRQPFVDKVEFPYPPEFPVIHTTGNHAPMFYYDDTKTFKSLYNSSNTSRGEEFYGLLFTTLKSGSQAFVMPYKDDCDRVMKDWHEDLEVAYQQDALACMSCADVAAHHMRS